MEIIVVGCGRLGAALAYRLDRSGHKVAIIDSKEAAFSNLPPDFSGRYLEGDALMQDVLERAGIEHAHGLAAVTNSDALNVVIAHVAREVYAVKNIVARNYDPRCIALFEEMNIQVISSTAWGAQRVEEMLFDSSVRTVFSAGNGEVEIYEFLIPAEWEGKRMGELEAAGLCLPVSITRAGKAILPEEGIPLREGDVIHFSATFEGANRVRSLLKGAQEA
ncbi:MAG TPA: TrkA family potassium uptake protein [Bellilinea sp.]|jgi:trk system potassium uptake protein TrkA|nr:TrkA family potassium uptake protein [Bellilinea sp.]